MLKKNKRLRVNPLPVTVPFMGVFLPELRKKKLQSSRLNLAQFDENLTQIMFSSLLRVLNARLGQFWVTFWSYKRKDLNSYLLSIKIYFLNTLMLRRRKFIMFLFYIVTFSTQNKTTNLK